MSKAGTFAPEQTISAASQRASSGISLPRPALSTVTIVAVFVAICVWGAISTHGFTTIGNIQAILTSSAFVGVIAIGMTLIMVSGYVFSLSLGLTAAVEAMAFLYGLRFGLALDIVFVLALGAAICGVQGWVVGGLGANPIIVTIAAGVVQEGLALDLTNGRTVYPPAGDSSYLFLTHNVGKIPVPFLVFLGIAVAADLLLRKGRFGRQVYAVGENRRAARAAAVSVPWIATGAFALAGVAAGAAGILLGAANQNATLSIQSTYTYDAIAAALVGGTSVTGGRGSASRTLFGAVVIATISSLLLLRGYSTGVQILVKGVIVLIVVAVVQLGDRGRRS
jgi:ribose transport system permease protein